LTRVIVAFSVLSLVLPAGAFAQGFTVGDKEVTLNASGVSQRDFDSTFFALQGSFGYFFTPNIEGVIRQGFQFSDVEGLGSTWLASTRGALDFHWDMGRWWPFLGASVGGVYGDSEVRDAWLLGIEGGVKYFVNTTTFVHGLVEYQWYLGGGADRGFDEGQFIYTIGLGFRW
jgi:hypothetical protein